MVDSKENYKFNLGVWGLKAGNWRSTAAHKTSCSQDLVWVLPHGTAAYDIIESRLWKKLSKSLGGAFEFYQKPESQREFKLC